MAKVKEHTGYADSCAGEPSPPGARPPNWTGKAYEAYGVTCARQIDQRRSTKTTARDEADERTWRGQHDSRRHPDAGQARARHGRRQQPLDRLGHRQGGCRAGRHSGVHLSGRRAQEARGAAGGGGGLETGAPLRCHGQSLHGPGLCRARPAMGQARLPGACHRLLRQGRARRPLRRHHGEELRPDHAHLLLLVHGAGPARREADERGRARC